MDKQTTVEEDLFHEVHRLNEKIFWLQKENNSLRKKHGNQKHIISRQRATISKLRKRLSEFEDKQRYVNVQKGKRRK